MRKIFQILIVGLALTTMLCVFDFQTAYPQEAPNVVVKVSQQTLTDGRVTYRYRIENKRITNTLSNTIVQFAVGYDYYHGIPELKVPPVGWTFESGIPPSNVKSPRNWRVDLITTEESAALNLQWQNDGSSDILPGQTVSGFSVTVPEVDNRYLTGHWTVFFADSDIASNLLEIDDTVIDVVDTTPPTVSVTLTPNILWPPNRKMVLIEAKISVTDNSDLNPEVKLVSITSNEQIDSSSDLSGVALGADDRNFFVRAERKGKQKQGRIYTVTYSATDASGNTGINSATITIPHDKRN